MKKLNKLKKDYDEDRDSIGVGRRCESFDSQAKAARKKRSILKQWTIGAAAAAALFIGSINMSPSFAQAMANVPILGAIVEVFTAQQLTVDEKTYQANVEDTSN